MAEGIDLQTPESSRQHCDQSVLQKKVEKQIMKSEDSVSGVSSVGGGSSVNSKRVSLQSNETHTFQKQLQLSPGALKMVCVCQTTNTPTHTYKITQLSVADAYVCVCMCVCVCVFVCAFVCCIR